LRLPALKYLVGGAAQMEMYLQDQPGITAVRITLVCASVTVTYDPSRWTPEALQQVLAGLSPTVLQHYQPPHRMRQAPPPSTVPWFELLLSSAAMTASVVGDPFTPLLLPLIASSAWSMFARAYEAVIHHDRLNVDVLDAAATTLLTVQGQWPAAAFMVWLVNLADFIRDSTMAQSRRAISRILDYQDQLAWVQRGDAKVRVAVGDIQPADIVVVYTGDRIPVDGTVVSEEATVDQQMLTGESLPVQKRAGDHVYAATVVQDGKLYLRAEQVGGETQAAKIVQVVQEAPARDTRIQNYAEQWANALVPFSFLGAGASWLLAGNVSQAATILIID
jgi:cation transport ATPase